MADLWLARVLAVLARGWEPLRTLRFAGCAAPSSSAQWPLAPAAAAAAAGAGSGAGIGSAAAANAGSGTGIGSAAAALAATSAAALAAALGGTPVAHCDAPQAGSIDPASVKAAVSALWHRLDEQLHRVEATLPRGTHLPPIPEPEVEVRRGGEVNVIFLLPQQLDVPGALQALRRHLRHPAFASAEQGSFGSSVSESSTSGAEGRATQLVRRSAALGPLTVEVEEPHDRSRPARLHFRGRATQQDLDLMSAALQSAMQPRRHGAVEELQEWGALFEGTPLGRHFESADPFLGHLREFIQGFERMAQGESWQLGSEDEGERGGWAGERDMEPTPLRRPKRFDELGRGGEWPPRQLEGGGEAGPSAEQLEAQRRQRQQESVAHKLEKNGAQVFMPHAHEGVDWGILAGYDEQKRQIEDTLLLALLHPEVYNEIAKGTRKQFASNRPRAVLFEGPPGTGKTTSARIIASQAAVPLVYIPLEAVVSKWYGESEKMLAEMLKTCESFPDGCIIFLDELDALATSRSSEMHEATRRVLGVLLRHLDGFDSNKRTVVVGATNRKQDLDPALISRFSAAVNFGLPSEPCRAEILRQYARHLGDAELLAVAGTTPGMAGRDLRDICEVAERRWASKIIRGQAAKGALPPLAEYLDAARQRLREMAGLPGSGPFQST